MVRGQEAKEGREAFKGFYGARATVEQNISRECFGQGGGMGAPCSHTREARLNM